MCIGSSSSDWSPPSHNLYISMHNKQRTKRSKVQVHWLVTRRRKRREEKSDEKDMEMQNIKLYLENMRMLEENERLRKKASLLHRENLTLMYELTSNRYFLAFTTYQDKRNANVTRSQRIDSIVYVT